MVLFIGSAAYVEAGEMEATQSTEGLCWSTYFGGNGGEYVNGSDLDDAENYYVAGWGNSTWATFPHTALSPAPVTPSVNPNGFISKFDKNDILKWTTLFGGGTNTLTIVYDVAVQTSASDTTAYVVGYTESANFPVLAAGSAYFDGVGTTGRVEQGFLFKVDYRGYRTWCTYFGDQKTAITGIDVATIRRHTEVVFTGYSKQLPNEQVTPPVNATHFTYSGGDQDAFVAKLNMYDQLQWRTYYGGTNTELGYDIAYASSGAFYVVGRTASSNVPLVSKAGAYNASYSGGDDVFLLQFNIGTTLTWATYYGGTADDEVFWNSLAVNRKSNNDVYIVGRTNSSSFPLKVKALAFNDGSYTGPDRGFIARFNGTSQALDWCTFFGHGNYAAANAIAFRKDGVSYYVAGAVSMGSIFLQASINNMYYQPVINANLPFPLDQDPSLLASTRTTYCGGPLISAAWPIRMNTSRPWSARSTIRCSPAAIRPNTRTRLPISRCIPPAIRSLITIPHGTVRPPWNSRIASSPGSALGPSPGRQGMRSKPLGRRIP
ncbi:MAG: hypothetical protein QM724_00540 [Flavobacteriales bacterium]